MRRSAPAVLAVAALACALWPLVGLGVTALSATGAPGGFLLQGGGAILAGILAALVLALAAWRLRADHAARPWAYAALAAGALALALSTVVGGALGLVGGALALMGR